MVSSTFRIKSKLLKYGRKKSLVWPLPISLVSTLNNSKAISKLWVFFPSVFPLLGMSFLMRLIKNALRKKKCFKSYHLNLTKECKAGLMTKNQLYIIWLKWRTKTPWSSQYTQKKAVDIIHYPFIIKALNKLGIEGNFLNLINGVYKKT